MGEILALLESVSKLPLLPAGPGFPHMHSGFFFHVLLALFISSVLYLRHVSGWGGVPRVLAVLFTSSAIFYLAALRHSFSFWSFY